jgi:hypothetical protein
MHLSVPLAFALLLQAAATTPTATPVPAPALAPTPTPASHGYTPPRTLQDFARERRLKTGAELKGSPRPVTVGTAAAAAGAKAGATPSASPAASPVETPAEAVSSAADVRVVSVSNDGIVDPTGGVRVTGTIRNTGDQTICGVVISVRILDSRGTYLSSAQTAPDVTVLPSGETTSFHTIVQAPPGVRGARVNPDRRDVTDGSTTMAGDWKLLGASEAKVVDASTCAK